MTTTEAIAFLDDTVPQKTSGLPDDLYYFISRTTPLVCVDLLVKDSRGRILLSWRDDHLYGKGWHIPGGIVRYKETFAQRIQKTAERELGVMIKFDSSPVWIEQLVDPDRDNLGHIIAFVYKCFVPEDFIPNNLNLKYGDSGYLEWHRGLPKNLLKIQGYYKEFINSV
jgi:colanic acid biosynthesis protein WcaH